MNTHSIELPQAEQFSDRTEGSGCEHQRAARKASKRDLQRPGKTMWWFPIGVFRKYSEQMSVREAAVPSSRVTIWVRQRSFSD